MRDDVLPDPEEIEREVLEAGEEKRQSPLAKRIYLIIIALILIGVLISTSGYHMLYFIAGRIVSSSADSDSTISLGGSGRIVFQGTTLKELRAHYLANQEGEMAFCLIGDKEGEDYIVEEVKVPRITRRGVYSVSSELCGNDSIIALHTHPYSRCLFSNQDIRYFHSFRSLSPKGIIGLMCQENRFTFYGQDIAD